MSIKQMLGRLKGNKTQNGGDGSINIQANGDIHVGPSEVEPGQSTSALADILERAQTTTRSIPLSETVERATDALSAGTATVGAALANTQSKLKSVNLSGENCSVSMSGVTVRKNGGAVCVKVGKYEITHTPTGDLLINGKAYSDE